jgi:dipeptidyl aminopeptidase/acylaminoacyl peptidase
MQMNRPTKLATFGASFLAAFLPTIGAAQTKSYTILDDLEMKRIPLGGLKLSPDGRYVATLETDNLAKGGLTGAQYLATGGCSNHNGQLVWIRDLKTHASYQLTRPGTTSWGISWSPNGQDLAFYSDTPGKAALCLWETATKKLKFIRNVIARGNWYGDQGPQWAPNSQAVYFLALPEGAYQRLSSTGMEGIAPERPGGIVSELVTRAANVMESKEDEEPRFAGPPPLIDVVKADAFSGQTFRVHRGLAIERLVISPSGQYLADFENQKQLKAAKRQSRFLFDLCVYKSSGEPLREGASNVRLRSVRSMLGRSLSWSPSSRMLSFETGGPDSDSSLYLVDPFTSTPPVNLTAASKSENAKAPGVGEDITPVLWTQDGQIIEIGAGQVWLLNPSDRVRAIPLGALDPDVKNPEVCADGDRTVAAEIDGALVVTGMSKKGLVLCRFPLAGGPTTVTSCGDKTIDYLSACKSGIAVGVQLDQHHPYSLYEIDLKPASADTAPNLIVDLNPALKEFNFVRPRNLRWEQSSGAVNEGLLFLPADASVQHKAPMIVWFYPGTQYGPGSADSISHGGIGSGSFAPDFYTSRGYAFLMAGTHNDGGGLEFEKQLEASLISGIEAAVATGSVDGKKVGVMGQSYGGWSIDQLITRTEMFQAAVSCAGAGDYVMMYLENLFQPFLETGKGHMDGTLWTQKDRFVDSSAVFRLDKVTTPTLFTDGSEDYPDQSRMMFNGLDRLGKPAALAIYPEGGHYWSMWRAKQQIDFWNRVFAWYDKYLMPGKPHRLDPSASDLSMYYPDGSGRLTINVPDVSPDLKSMFHPAPEQVALIK